MKKILAITGIRSDYDLLSSLFFRLNCDKEVELKLLVGNAHLSKTYGYSVRQIEDDGFDILLRVESLIDGDSYQSRIKAGSIFLQNSIDAVAHYNPDIIIFAGDRMEVIIGALLGGYLEIPTIHFYAGDQGIDGHIDNPVRHAASKLSTCHMVTLQQHKDRLVSIGENPDRIKVIGSIALDRFINSKPYNISRIKKYFKISHGFDKFSLVIYHPAVGEEKRCNQYFENILKALKDKGINAFVNIPNTDPGNKKILDVINQYQQDGSFCFTSNMSREHFLSVFKRSMFIIGNSSAGIIESPSVPVPAINVGKRQSGRFADKNVISSENDCASIKDAIDKATSIDFISSIKNIENTYGDGQSAELALKYIKEIDFDKLIRKTEDPLLFRH
jgi:GDP/UDP-N,N'-diacetylbacillosamine 2-epimerase (hydrolysing)